MRLKVHLGISIKLQFQLTMDCVKGSQKWEYYFDNFDKCCTSAFNQRPKVVDSPKLRRNLLPDFELVAHASTKSLPGRTAGGPRRKQRAERKAGKLAKSQDIESIDVKRSCDRQPTKQQSIQVNVKPQRVAEPNPPRSKLPDKTSRLKENSLANRKLLTAIAAKVDRSVLLDCDFLANLTGKSQLQGSTVKTAKNRVKNMSGLFDGNLSQRICSDLKALQSKGSKQARIVEKRSVKPTASKAAILVKTTENTKSTALLTGAKFSKPVSKSILELIKSNQRAKIKLRESKLSLTDASHTFGAQQETMPSTGHKSILQIQINKKLKSLTQQLFEKYSPRRSKEIAKRCRSTGKNKKRRLKGETSKATYFNQGRSTGKADKAYLKRSFCNMLERDCSEGRSNGLLRSMVEPSTATRDSLQKTKHRNKLMSFTNLN